MTRKTDTTGLVTPGRYVDHQEGLYHSIILSQSQYFDQKYNIYKPLIRFCQKFYWWKTQVLCAEYYSCASMLTNFLKSHGQTVSRFDDSVDKTPRWSQLYRRATRSHYLDDDDDDDYDVVVGGGVVDCGGGWWCWWYIKTTVGHQYNQIH